MRGMIGIYQVSAWSASCSCSPQARCWSRWRSWRGRSCDAVGPE